MATAAMISCAETRQADAKPRARQPRQADLDRWWDGLEANRPDDTPSLEELTPAVLAMRQEWTGTVAEARPLSERRTPWELPKAGASLAAAGPCETAQELCAELTGLSVRAHPVHTLVGELSHQLDVLAVSPTAAAIAERVAELAVGQTGRPGLGLAIDGALVPTRPEEAKGVRFSLVDRQRIGPLLRGSQGCRDEDGGAALRRVPEAGVIPEAQVRLGVSGDGAQWIGN